MSERYLLDTNVVSELIRPQPNQALVDWVQSIDEDLMHISVLSFMEIKSGVDRMAPGKRRNALAEWLSNDLPQRFETRILPITTEIALECGSLSAAAIRKGRRLDTADALIAGTARVHGLTVATRNTKDFANANVDLLNPWEA